jgi:hypothetical protein
MSSIRLAGTIPFSASCRRCGKHVAHAGAYWQNKIPAAETLAKFRAKVLCDTCSQYRRRIGQTLEQFLNETVVE